MGHLFTVTFENNKLYDPYSLGFDYAQFLPGGANAGGMEITTEQVYQGSYAIKVTPFAGGGLWAMGAKRTRPLTKFRQAFYLHPGTISLPTSGYIIISRNFWPDSIRRRYTIILYYNGSALQLQGGIYNSSDSASNTGYRSLTYQTGWNLVEMYWQVLGSGTNYYLYENGNLVGNAALANLNTLVNYPAIGAYNASASVSGSFYLDYWRANDDGSVIGA